MDTIRMNIKLKLKVLNDNRCKSRKHQLIEHDNSIMLKPFTCPVDKHYKHPFPSQKKIQHELEVIKSYITYSINHNGQSCGVIIHGLMWDNPEEDQFFTDMIHSELVKYFPDIQVQSQRYRFPLLDGTWMNGLGADLRWNIFKKTIKPHQPHQSRSHTI